MVSPHDPFHPRSAPASDRVDRKCASPGPETADLVLDGGGYLMMSGAAPPEDGDAALVRAHVRRAARRRRPRADSATCPRSRDGRTPRPRIGPEGADPLPDRRLAGAVSE